MLDVVAALALGTVDPVVATAAASVIIPPSI